MSLHSVAEYLGSSGPRIGLAHQLTLRRAIEMYPDGMCWNCEVGDSAGLGLILVTDPKWIPSPEELSRALRPDGVVYLVGSEDPVFDHLKRRLYEYGHQGCCPESRGTQLYWGGLCQRPSCPLPAGELPLIVSYYTEDSPYEALAARLRASCEANKLEYRIIPVQHRGSWERNCAVKAEVIARIWEVDRKPVLWVDADAIIRRRPSLLSGISADFGINKMRGWKFASGTVFFNQTTLAGQLLEHWIGLCKQQSSVPDQVLLDLAWELLSRAHPLETIWLPQAYTRIFDQPLEQGEDPVPVVEHFQASRQYKARMSGGLARLETTLPPAWRRARRASRPAVPGFPGTHDCGARKETCVASVDDEQLHPIDSSTRGARELFASIHGFAVETRVVPPGRPSSWYKFSIIEELFERGYEQVFWLDADAVPVRFDVSPLTCLRNDKDLYLSRHVVNGRERPNTGVLLIRRSDWSRRLLRQCQNYLDMGWNDEAALLDIIGYHHLLNPGREPDLNHAILDGIEWLDLAWNSVPGVSESPDPIVVHYSGHTLLRRLVGAGFHARQALARSEGVLASPETKISLGDSLLDNSLPPGEWHQAEPFRWTAVCNASLPIIVFEGQTAVEVELATGHPSGCSVDIGLDGRLLGSALFDGPGIKRFRFDLGDFRQGERSLGFIVRRLWQPSVILQSEDARFLGIAVGEVRLYTESESIGLTVILARQETLDSPHIYKSWIGSVSSPLLLAREYTLKWEPPANTDLVVTHESCDGPKLTILRRAMEKNCPVLVVADSIETNIERLLSRQPVPGHKFACIGRLQARLYDALGADNSRNEVIGMPALAPVLGSVLRRSADNRFRILVSALFEGPECPPSELLVGLDGIRNWFAQQTEYQEKQIEVVWRVSNEFAAAHDVVGESTPIERLLNEIDAMITFPSVDLLYGMLSGIPTALVDYSDHPSLLQASWRISSNSQIGTVVGEMMNPGLSQLEIQKWLLADAAEDSSLAKARMLRLIETMRLAGRRARVNGTELRLPRRIVALDGDAPKTPVDTPDTQGPDEHPVSVALLQREYTHLIRTYDCDTEWLRANLMERMDAFRSDLADESRAAFHLDRYLFACRYANNRTVLDVASGLGYGSWVLAAEGHARSVVGVERNLEAVNYARHNYGSAIVRFLRASCETIPLVLESFDLIVSFETLEHVEGETAFLKAIHRLLKPNGVLVLSTPNRWGLGAVAPFHVRDYDLHTLSATLRRFFSIDAVFNQNSGTPHRPQNHGRPREIVPTTESNQEQAECFLVVARRKE